MKELWIADNERIMEDFNDGEIDLGEAGNLLEEQGFDPHEIRDMLSREIGYPIPKGYFGKEKEVRHATTR